MRIRNKSEAAHLAFTVMSFPRRRESSVIVVFFTIDGPPPSRGRHYWMYFKGCILWVRYHLSRRDKITIAAGVGSEATETRGAG